MERTIQRLYTIVIKYKTDVKIMKQLSVVLKTKKEWNDDDCLTLYKRLRDIAKKEFGLNENDITLHISSKENY